VRNTTKHDLHDIGAYEFRVPEAMEPIDPIRYEAVIPAGESKVFSYRMRALRRGRYILPGPTAVSAFPFGLTQSKRFHAQPQPLIVYPAFHRLVHADVPAGLRHQPGGIVLTSHIGESMEFIGNREYRPGDRLRDLHPRSWARVGYPVVKQFQEEFLTRIAVLVDTYPPPWLSRRGLPSPASRSLEAVLSMAAGISDYLARQEYIVDLFAAGPELYHFQAGRSLGYLDNILDILACIEACKDDALDVVGARFTEEVGRMSTVIMVLMDWDEKREALVRRVESMGVSVKPIVVSSRHELSDLMGIGTAARVVTPEQVEAGLEQI